MHSFIYKKIDTSYELPFVKVMASSKYYCFGIEWTKLVKYLPLID